MIKILAIGFWVCLVSLGSSYAVALIQSPAGATPDKEANFFQGLDYKKTDPITVPIISQEQIQGYILARFVYTIDGERANKLAVPPDPFIVDQVFQAIYSGGSFDFEHPKKYDLTALANNVKDEINKKYNDSLIHEVLVDQFDYISRDDVRSNKQAARVSQK